MRLARSSTAVLACAACLASIPAAAEARAWSSPQTLGSSTVAAPLLAGGASLSVAAWLERDQSIDVCELAGPFARFGPAQRIRAGSGAPPTNPGVRLAALAVSPRGDAVVVWIYSGIPSDPPQYSVRSALSGQWSAPATLERGGDGISGLTAGIDSTGAVTLAWIGTRIEGSTRMDALRTQVRLPDGSMLPVQTIAEDPIDTSFMTPTSPVGYSSPQLAVAGSGAAVLAWDRPRAAGSRQVLLARRAPGDTTFGAARAVSTPLSGGAAGRALLLRLQAGVDERGGAVLAWLSRAGGRAILLAQRIGPAGQAGALQRLSAAGAGDPRLAVNGRGDSVLAWRFHPRHPARVRAAVAPAGQGFGRPATLAAPAGMVLAPRVALDPAGDAIVAWRVFTSGRRDSGIFAKDSRLWSSLRLHGGRFTAPARLPAARFAAFGGVALPPGGNAVAAWTDTSGATSPVLAAVLR